MYRFRTRRRRTVSFQEPVVSTELWRTNEWLAARLQTLCQTHYPDVAIENKLFVRFGRKTINRFGSIIAKPKKGYSQPVTYITINGLFVDPSVPEYVIDATLLHEFAHYTHGFHSPRPKQHKHPHRGGVVEKEIINRGGELYLTQQNKWIKEEYPTYLRSRQGNATK